MSIWCSFIKHETSTWCCFETFCGFTFPATCPTGFLLYGGMSQKRSCSRAAMSSYSSSFFLGNSEERATPEFGKPMRDMFLLEEGTGDDRNHIDTLWRHVSFGLSSLSSLMKFLLPPSPKIYPSTQNYNFQTRIIFQCSRTMDLTELFQERCLRKGFNFFRQQRLTLTGEKTKKIYWFYSYLFSSVVLYASGLVVSIKRVCAATKSVKLTDISETCQRRKQLDNITFNWNLMKIFFFYAGGSERQFAPSTIRP